MIVVQTRNRRIAILIPREHQSSSPDLPKLLEPVPGIYVRQEIDNISWADMGEYTLVIDALERRECEDEVITLLSETVPDKPVRYLINTHTHYDHVALNDSFHKRFNTQIINLRMAAVPSSGRIFAGSRRQAVLLPLPGCHTAHDCAVLFPDDRVLFVGDIFGWGLIPWDGRLRDEKRNLIMKIYQRLISFNADVVVPGHGPLASTAELRRWVDYFIWLYASVARLRQEGLDNDSIAQELAPPADMQHWWRFTLWKHQDSLKKVLKVV